MKRQHVPRSLAALAAISLGLAGCSLGGPTTPAAPETSGAGRPSAQQVGGRVSDDAGRPVIGARVALGDATALTDNEGRFVIARPDADGLLTVATTSTYGFAPVDAQGAEEVRVTTHPSPAGATRLRFAGEVRTGGSLLPRSADTATYVDALAGVAPLLEDAEASAVTLASPLVDDPAPTDVDAGPPALAAALAEVGVDVVGLATDRIADAGRGAVQGTLDLLADADVAAFGAGRDLDAAWTPAVLDLGRRSVAYVGCQVGAPDAAWAATAGRAGAAPCTPARLRAALADAATQADTLVVAIRDDRPYAGEASAEFVAAATLATRSGARVVVGSGAHVPGEVRDLDGTTVARSTGDLLSDDLSWEAREGYLLRTDIGDDGVLAAAAEPLTRTDGLPSMVRGDLAEQTARIAGSAPDGPLVLADDIAVSGGVTWSVDQATVPAPVADDRAPLALDGGWWLPPAGQPGVMTGYDLLPTGSFEDVDADPRTDGAVGWLLSPGTRLARSARGEPDAPRVCEGEEALVLAPDGERPATAFTSDRITLPETVGISISAQVSDLDGGTLDGRISLEWFDGDRRLGEDFIDLDRIDRDCQTVRIDAVPPTGADVLRPIVEVGRGAVLVDDLHVVAWQPGRNGGRRWGWIRVFEPLQVTLVADVPRGGAAPAGPFVDAGTPGS